MSRNMVREVVYKAQLYMWEKKMYEKRLEKK